jgi:hypothetical protein
MKQYLMLKTLLYSYILFSARKEISRLLLKEEFSKSISINID